MATEKKIVIKLEPLPGMRTALLGLVFDIEDRVRDLIKNGLPFGGPKEVQDKLKAYEELAKALVKAAESEK